MVNEPSRRDWPANKPADEDWVSRMAGSLGQGTPEEFDYSADINLMRFADDANG